MALPDVTTLTTDELSDLLNAVINEQERRQRLAATPQRLYDEAQRFIDDGGDPAAIVLPTEPTPQIEGETSGDPQE